MILNQGFSNFSVLRPISKKIFLGDPLMDNVDFNDAFERHISLQKRLYLICQANLFRLPKITFRDP